VCEEGRKEGRERERERQSERKRERSALALFYSSWLPLRISRPEHAWTAPAAMASAIIIQVFHGYDEATAPIDKG
jgi:hypothetical protein